MKVLTLIQEYKWKFVLTMALVLIEAFLTLLYPLFIGMAIDGAIAGSYEGAIYLGTLGLASLIVGGGRRVFDSRLYALVYQKKGLQVISEVDPEQSSVKSARLGMMGGLVEFMEHSLPELINTMIGFGGVTIIIASLNISVFYGCLITTLIIFMIYWISGSKTTYLNKSSNDELEKQVDIVSRNDSNALKDHLKKMMRWNIKLSDLEALNFSLTWLVLMIFLVVSIVLSAKDNVIAYGALLSLILYIFQYIESIINLPFFYQNWLRLQEIQGRLN